MTPTTKTKKSRTYRPRTQAEKVRDAAAAKRRRLAKSGKAVEAKAARPSGRPRKSAAAKVRVRKAATAAPGRADNARTAYRLVDGIPETPKAGTTGREILDTMKAAGQSTIPELIAATKAPPATVRKWVHMLRTVKAVESVPASVPA